MADITAARLNNLQSRIELILGTGSGTTGYGQAVVSTPVNNTSDVIDADHINDLYTDLVRARIHQVGVTETGIRQVIEDLNIIAEDTSQQVTDSGTTQADADGTKKGIADYELLMNSIESDKALIHPSQALLEAKPEVSSTRTATWNGLIYHVFTVTFTDENHRRHFFNAGGEIRLASNNTGASSPKGLDWAALCSEVGTIKFTSTSTTATGSGQGYAIGNSNLTASYQTAFLKTGSGSYSGVYAGNLYTVKVRIANPQVIEFRIEFNDVVTDNQVDNNVDGTLTSSVQQFRAVGANSVTVPTPTYFTTTQLSGFNVPVEQDETYVLSSVPQSAVNEGGTITYTLSTTGVPNATAIGYTITGIDINDLVNGSLTGNMIVTNNTATLTILTNADGFTDGAENITLTLNNGKASRVIALNDTSTGAVGYYYDPQWYNEFESSWLAGIPKSTAITIGSQISSLLYLSNSQFTNALGQTRYGLYRRPGAAGPAYWTKQWYYTFRQDGSTFDGNIAGDSGWTHFTRVVMSAADSNCFPVGFTVNGVPIANVQENWECERVKTANKAFISGDGVGDFGNRGTPGNTSPQDPIPPSPTFAFTVTPTSGMNWNRPSSQGAVEFFYTILCTAGEGAVTVVETARPTVIPVGIDDAYSSNYPDVGANMQIASKTYALSSGETRQVKLSIYPGQEGTWQGSFAFLESTGAGQTFSRLWGGTFGSG